jgi:hypothetical protein
MFLDVGKKVAVSHQEDTAGKDVSSLATPQFGFWER